MIEKKDDWSHSLFIMCDCSSHMFQIERYYEDKRDNGFNLAIWHYGHNGNIRRWKERLRWCWRILKTGNPWADSIIITNEKAKEISNFILNEVNSHEKTNKE